MEQIQVGGISKYSKSGARVRGMLHDNGK